MKILVINPGSTSTKIAVFNDEKSVFVRSIRHTVEQLSVFPTIMSQFDFRKSLVLEELRTNNISLDFDAIIGRGGLVKPIKGGVYEVNDAMKKDTLNAMKSHACNLGGLIAAELSGKIDGCRAFIADPAVVDEMEPIAKLTGSPLMNKMSVWHALNQKAISRRYAKEHGKKYEELNLIVAHLGGGISVAAHSMGRAIDVNNALDGEGPFSPERAGSLPSGQLVELCFSGKYSKDEVKKMLVGKAGLAAHLGSTDVQKIIEKINSEGFPKAVDVLNAMSYNIAKSIGALSTVLKGKVDAILLTGGIAYNEFVTDEIINRVSFIAPVHIYPGEDEMEALALNALYALNGEVDVIKYE